MEQISMRELVKRGVVRNLSVLRENTNGYPFITLLNKKGEAQNIYFGQKSAVLIKDNFEVGQSVVAALKDATVIKSTNAEGETRYKLSLPNPTSKYSTDTELMDVFGIEEVETEFSVAAFEKQFSAQPALVNQPE